MSCWVKKEDHAQQIHVFVRCRPFSDVEIQQKSPSVVTVNADDGKVCVLDSCGNKTKTFVFDQVFDAQDSQDDVYKSVASSMISEVLLGYSCTVFVYGQTGTGKTYTLEGERAVADCFLWDKDLKAGIIPRAVHQLFEMMEELGDIEARVSFLELYNEELYDLLSPSNDMKKLKLYELANGSILVHGLEEIPVFNKHDVYDLLEKGSERKKKAFTLFNAASSRSHTVFSVIVRIRNIDCEGREVLKTGKFNLVDLAGSENIERSGAIEKQAREAGSINQSLLTLGRVIKALVEKGSHVPYRESKLTRILKDSLGGSAKTSIIATISPALCNLEETINTLDYASKAKYITNKPEINQKRSNKCLIEEYAQEIQALQRDLIAVKEKSGVLVDPNEYRALKNALRIKDEALRDLEAQRDYLQEQKDMIKRLIMETNATELELQKKNEFSMRDIEELERKKEVLKVNIEDANEVLNAKVEEFLRLQDAYKLIVEKNAKSAAYIDMLKDFDVKAAVVSANLRKRIEDAEKKSSECKITIKKFLETFLQSIKSMDDKITQFQEELNKNLFVLLAQIDHNCGIWKKSLDTLVCGLLELQRTSILNCDKLLNVLQAKFDDNSQSLLQTVLPKNDAVAQIISKYMLQIEIVTSTGLKLLGIMMHEIEVTWATLKVQLSLQDEQGNNFIKYVREVLCKIKHVVIDNEDALEKLLKEFEAREINSKRDELKRDFEEKLETVILSVEALKKVFADYSTQAEADWKQSYENVEKMKQLNENSAQFLSKSHEVIGKYDTDFAASTSACNGDVESVLEQQTKHLENFSHQFKYVLSRTEDVVTQFIAEHKKTVSSEAERKIKVISDDTESILKTVEGVQASFSEMCKELSISSPILKDHHNSMENMNSENNEQEKALLLDIEHTLEKKQCCTKEVENCDKEVQNIPFEDLHILEPSGSIPNENSLVYDYSIVTSATSACTKQTENFEQRKANMLNKLRQLIEEEEQATKHEEAADNNDDSASQSSAVSHVNIDNKDIKLESHARGSLSKSSTTSSTLRQQKK